MAEPLEVVRDAKPMPLNQVDPNQNVPPSVKRAAERAAALHAAVYSAPQPEPTPAPAPVAAVVPQPDPTPAPQPALAPAPQGDPQTEAQWEHKYNSMHGRWKSAQQTIGQMQEQMTQLGDELMRTQALLTRASGVHIQGQPAPASKQLVTAEEIANYSPEMIDVVKRAAVEAIGPELDAVKAENTDLKNRFHRDAVEKVYTALDSAVPDWRTINDSDRFKAWLRLRDVYSGGVRWPLLKAAFQAADAARVTAFFEGFIADEIATGNVEPPTPQPAAGDPPPAPRIAAVPLVSLAAPGRAKPAAGNDGQQPVDKPVITRAEITAFYREVRRGSYVGREAEKDQIERRIFAAQNDGRVR